VRTERLGSSGPEISVIGFGAWEAGGGVWGPNLSERTVIEAMRAGFDAGINWVDTAEVYGDGLSETLVGKAVAGRDDVLVATKVAPRPDGTGFRADQVRRACSASLERLGRERLDIYQLHWRDDEVPVEETWGAMAELVEEGLIRHIGVSNFDRELIERCERIRHVDSLQPQSSVLHLKHRDLIRWCGDQGIGVVCYGPRAYGLLTGAIGPDTEFEPGDWRSGRGGVSYYREMFAPGKLERSLAVVDALRPIADRLAITVAQLALAWVVHQPGVTAAIAGSRNPDHVRQNAGAGEVELDEDALGEIEAILPLGPNAAAVS
jgi:aryl-alcohol dehydrogenase-like predicted oxidoreductase